MYGFFKINFLCGSYRSFLFYICFTFIVLFSCTANAGIITNGTDSLNTGNIELTSTALGIGVASASVASITSWDTILKTVSVVLKVTTLDGSVYSIPKILRFNPFKSLRLFTICLSNPVPCGVVASAVATAALISHFWIDKETSEIVTDRPVLDETYANSNGYDLPLGFDGLPYTVITNENSVPSCIIKNIDGIDRFSYESPYPCIWKGKMVINRGGGILYNTPTRSYLYSFSGFDAEQFIYNITDINVPDPFPWIVAKTYAYTYPRPVENVTNEFIPASVVPVQALESLSNSSDSIVDLSTSDTPEIIDVFEPVEITATDISSADPYIDSTPTYNYDTTVQVDTTSGDVINVNVEVSTKPVADVVSDLRKDVYTAAGTISNTITASTDVLSDDLSDINSNIDVVNSNLDDINNNLDQLNNSVAYLPYAIPSTINQLANSNTDLAIEQMAPAEQQFNDSSMTFNPLDYFLTGESWLPSQCPQPLTFSFLNNSEVSIPYDAICDNAPTVKGIILLIAAFMFLAIIFQGVR